MGWLFSSSWNSRKDLIEHLRSPSRFGPGFELLKSSAVGNNHWYLARLKDSGKVFIGLDLMKGGTRSEPGWGYKDLCASMGPCEVNCPVTYLDLASPPDPADHEIAWRERVRAYHAQKAKLRKVPLESGATLVYGGITFTLVQSLGRRGWLADGNGQRYHLTAKQVNAALRAASGA